MLKGIFIMTIGERIKDFRKMRNLTQNELADEMGVSVQAVSKWETDKSAPDISLLVPLSTVLGVSTDTLLGKTESGFEELMTIDELHEKLDGKEWYEVEYEYYKYVMKLSKKYPHDDNITNICLYSAYSLIRLHKKGFMNFSQEEVNKFFSIAEKTKEKIMKSDLSMFSKCNAHCTFVETCALMGY